MLLQQFSWKLLITIMQILIKVIIVQFLLNWGKIIQWHNQLYHAMSEIKPLHLFEHVIERLMVHLSHYIKEKVPSPVA